MAFSGNCDTVMTGLADSASRSDAELETELLHRQFNPRVSAPLNEFERSADYANYFITYGYIYHQKQMLQDDHRMHTYHSAIMQNAATHFKDKVVLDLGTGTGVLAMWAAHAGARKVYAVEATPIANRARQLIEANGLSNVIEVIQGNIENLPKPAEPADTMVSEWMGYLLLREAMLDSVVWARDNGWMKKDCAMFPSHARLVFAPISTPDTNKSLKQLVQEVRGWESFEEKTTATFGIDFSCLKEEFIKEQRVYHLQSVLWRELKPNAVVGRPCVTWECDLHTLKVEDYKTLTMPFSCQAVENAEANGMAGWFETDFRGPAHNPCPRPSTLTTAPNRGVGTHWGQQVFYITPSVDIQMGELMEGTITLERNNYNHRLLDICLQHRKVSADGTQGEQHTGNYVLE